MTDTPKKAARKGAVKPASNSPAVLVALRDFVMAQRSTLASEVQDEADRLIVEIDKLI